MNLKNKQRLLMGSLLVGALGLSAGLTAAGISGGNKSSTSSNLSHRSAKLQQGGPSKAELQQRFIENNGQWDERARFLARTGGIDTWLTDTGIVYDVYKTRSERKYVNGVLVREPAKVYRQGHTFKLSFDGSVPGKSVGYSPTNTKVGYIGWNAGERTAGTYNEARLQGIYPGVDLNLYFDKGAPRYDVFVNPGADPSQIKMRFEGANNTKVLNPTTLEVGTSVGPLKVTGLYAYQLSGVRKVQVQAAFRQNEDGSVSFNLGAYDKTRPLVIDPVVYSTLVGGPGSADELFAVKVDALNNAYMCGVATAGTYPTSIGAYDETLVGADGVVTKLLPDGSDVAYSTYIGGSGTDVCFGIDIDSTGAAYVVGRTSSTNFDANVLQTTIQPPIAGGTPNDVFDGFVMKLAPSGTSRVFGSYLGGNRFDQATDVAVDSTGALYIVGDTLSSAVGAGAVAYPTASPFQATMKGTQDVFLTKLDPTGASRVYSTFLGGSNASDSSVGVEVDIDGFAYVGMNTSAADAPTTGGAYDTVANGSDNLILKLAQDGGSLVFGTYLGGNSGDTMTGFDIDSTNDIFVTGVTSSFNYPHTAGAFDGTYNTGNDTYITKMNRLGTGLVYSTFTRFDPVPSQSTSLVVDDLGYAHITGFVFQTSTTTTNIPITANADQPVYNGPITTPTPGPPGDAILLVMNPTGTGILYCSYWGGAWNEIAWGIAVDGARNDYVVGETLSANDRTIPFPTTPGAFKESFANDEAPIPADPATPDAFAIKIKTRIPYTITGVTLAPNPVEGGTNATGTVTISSAASDSSVLVSITNDNNSTVTTPLTTTIPVGATSATFPIQTDVNVSQDTNVKITCTIEGDSKFANLLVRPTLQALTLSNDTVIGGNSVGARVTLNFPAPTGGRTVGLTSSIPALAQVPPSLTVPAGQTTAVFDVTTVGVAAPQTVDITTGFGGVLRTQTLTVIPARLFAISFAPNRITGGLSTTGIVQLDGNSPNGGVTVTLSSSDPALTVPASVSIAPQTQTASFNATSQIVPINTSVVVTATLGADVRTAVVDVLYASLSSLGVNPDSFVGGNTATGTVGLDRPATGSGVPIALSSSNPAVASVPASVTIPAGAAFANFTVTTTRVAANTNVTITATRGSVILNAIIQIRPMTFSLSVAPSSMPGGSSATGTVTLVEAAPPGGIVIALSSDNASATVPSSITIAAGDTSGTFTVASVPVAVDTLVTITGDYFVGMTLASSDTDTVTLTAPTPTNLSITPSTVAGGQSATGTLTISGPAPAGGITATLNSSNVAAAQVPASVTVLQNQTTGSFTITTSAVPANTTVTITATIGVNNRTANLTILKAKLTGISFAPSRVRGGFQTTQMTVTLDAAAPPGGAVVNLSQTNPAVANIPVSVTVLAGQTSRTVTITTKRVSRTLTTQVTANYTGDEVSAQLTATR